MAWYRSQFPTIANPHTPGALQTYLHLLSEETSLSGSDLCIVEQVMVQFSPLTKPILKYDPEKSQLLESIDRCLLKRPTTPTQAAVVPVYLDNLHLQHKMLQRWHHQLKRVQTANVLGEEGDRRRCEHQLASIIRHWHRQTQHQKRKK